MKRKKFCVIGCGFYGLNLALQLTAEGAEVIAVDERNEVIDSIAAQVAHAIKMDTTDKTALKSLPLDEFDAVVVAIGKNFENSILTTALLQEIGVKKLFTRVTTQIHERILRLMGITELLLPESDAAVQLSTRLMNPGILHAFDITKEFGVFEISAPEQFVNKTIQDLELRRKFRLNVVTVKTKVSKQGLLSKGEREKFEIVGVPSPDYKFTKDDNLIVFGKEADLKKVLEG